MIPTKTRAAIWTTQTLTAGAAATNSPWLDLSAIFEAMVDIRITNGATGPGVPAQVQIQVANNYNAGSPTLPTNYGGALIGSSINNDIIYFPILIPMGVQAIRLVAGSNTVQNVTVDADISYVTAIT